jgi:hypothetical protein
MNLVKLILDQLVGGNLTQLSTLLGVSDSKAQAAASAALPALLSGFSSLAGSGQGGQRLISALGQFQPEKLGDLASLLTGEGEEISTRGNGLLTYLMEEKTLAGLASAVAGFSGLGEKQANQLLGYLSPLVMGALAQQFPGKKIDGQGLVQFFAEQKTSIAAGLPPRLSLAQVPGLAALSGGTSAPHVTPAPQGKTQGIAAGAPATSRLGWLLPLIGVVCAALAVQYWPKSKSAVPAPAKATEAEAPAPRGGGMDFSAMKAPAFGTMATGLATQFQQLTESLTGISDAATAEAALPTLTELAARLEGIQKEAESLTKDSKVMLPDLIQEIMVKPAEQLKRVALIPDVSAAFRPILERIVKAISTLGGLEEGVLALPAQ